MAVAEENKVKTEVFDKLKVLQDILVEKYRIENLKIDTPKALINKEELLERLKTEFIKSDGEYKEVRSKVASLKTQLAEAEAKREQGEKGMDSITTHREYEALDKEIKDATELEQSLRKELQKEEKNFQDLDEKVKKQEEAIKDLEGELNSQKESQAQQIKEYEDQLEELKKREEEIIPGIDPEIIFKFERIIKSKESEGIVAVKGNVCDGCHMILPAQFANEVHAGKKILFCPYCSRILYYPEEENNDEQMFSLIDTGSLSDLDDDDFDEAFDEDEEYEEESRHSRDDMKEMGFDM